MTGLWEECRRLSDAELTARLKAATARERKALAWLLVHLSEFDARRLQAESANPSLFMYCTRELGYSEGAAYKRIQGARAVRRFPIALEMLADGRIHLAAVVVLAPHLTERNHLELLEGAKGKTKRDVEAMVACFEPRDPRPDSIRHFSLKPESSRQGPDNTRGLDEAPVLFDIRVEGSADNASGLPNDIRPPVDSVAPPSGPSEVSSAGRGVRSDAQEGARISFDAGEDFLKLLERSRQVLRHKYPEGRLEDVLAAGLQAMLDKKDPDRRLRRLAERREKRRKKDDALFPAG